MDKTAVAETRALSLQELLKRIQKKIADFTNNFWAPNVYHMLVVFLIRDLAVSKVAISTTDAPDVSLHTRLKVFNLYCDVMKELRELKLTKTERVDVLAKLLVWSAGEFAQHYYLPDQEHSSTKPRLVYSFKTNKITR